MKKRRLHWRIGMAIYFSVSLSFQSCTLVPSFPIRGKMLPLGHLHICISTSACLLVVNLKYMVLQNKKESLTLCTFFFLPILQLSYDHQVLLDYLISKDTGISCAEYLLRCFLFLPLLLIYEI